MSNRRKGHKKPPAQYRKGAESGAEQIPVVTDLKVLLNGWKSARVAHGGMEFQVIDKVISGKKVLALTVPFAPAGTALQGFDKDEVFLTLKQVQANKFYSSLPEGSTRRKKCEALWQYFHDVFVAAGLKVVEPKSVKKPAEKRDDAVYAEASPSVADMEAGKHGKYSFDGDGESRAVFEVFLDSYKPKGETNARKSVVVKAIAIEKGHPLYGKVKVGTFVHHNRLTAKGIPDFRGGRAGDAEKMWEYLTDVMAEHRAQTYEQVFDSQNCGVMQAPQFGGHQRNHAKRPPAQASA